MTRSDSNSQRAPLAASREVPGQVVDDGRVIPGYRRFLREPTACGTSIGVVPIICQARCCDVRETRITGHITMVEST